MTIRDAWRDRMRGFCGSERRIAAAVDRYRGGFIKSRTVLRDKSVDRFARMRTYAQARWEKSSNIPIGSTLSERFAEGYEKGIRRYKEAILDNRLEVVDRAVGKYGDAMKKMCARIVGEATQRVADGIIRETFATARSFIK